MRKRLTSFSAYCYIWLMVGFFFGTLVLVGPVRLLTSAMRTRGWSERAEDLAMIGVIAAYVLASALIAWWLYRRVSACRTRRARVAIPATLTIAAAACLWAWLNPTVLAGIAGGMGDEVVVNGGGSQFVFGPYPDRARLSNLKQQGFAAVVSLQHPAVVPFEPAGIADEQRATAEVGLPFIHAPMVPWISSNQDALNRIRQLAREGSGKYYVHCGLGRDRVNVVKRMLQNEGANVSVAEGFVPKTPRTFRDRLRDKRGPMERGDFKEIDRDIWLIPYPNKHELFANMLSGQMKHVVLLLDPASPPQRGWIDESTRFFNEFAVPYTVDPLAPRDIDHARAVVAKVRELPRPLAVVVPFTPPRRPTDDVDTLMDAFGESGKF